MRSLQKFVHLTPLVVPNIRKDDGTHSRPESDGSIYFCVLCEPGTYTMNVNEFTIYKCKYTVYKYTMNMNKYTVNMNNYSMHMNKYTMSMAKYTMNTNKYTKT
jgi:hypothetical protein